LNVTFNLLDGIAYAVLVLCWCDYKAIADHKTLPVVVLPE